MSTWGLGSQRESRIMITFRSKVNVWDLVPDIGYCVAMPSLSWAEAGELFLRSAAPSKSIFGLSVEERRIVGLCIKECMYYDPDGSGEGSLIGDDEVGILFEVHVRNSRGKSFHPMALSVLGDFFRRYFSSRGMLGWTGYLEENKDPLWDVWKLRDGIGGIFGLQFHSLPSSEQLLLLDIAFFLAGSYEEIYGEDHFVFTMLCRVHVETEGVMMRRVSAFLIVLVRFHGGLSNVKLCCGRCSWMIVRVDVILFEKYMAFNVRVGLCVAAAGFGKVWYDHILLGNG